MANSLIERTQRVAAAGQGSHSSKTSAKWLMAIGLGSSPPEAHNVLSQKHFETIQDEQE